MIAGGFRRVLDILIALTVVVCVAFVASPAAAEGLDGDVRTSTDKKVDEPESDEEAVDPEGDEEAPETDDDAAEDDGTDETTDAEDEAAAEDDGDTTEDDADASSDSGSSYDGGSAYDDGSESVESYHDDSYADDGAGFAGTAPQADTSTSVAERSTASGDRAPEAAALERRSLTRDGRASRRSPTSAADATRSARRQPEPASTRAERAATARVASTAGPRIESIPLTATSPVDAVRRAPRGVNLAAVAVLIWAIGIGIVVVAKRRRERLVRLA